MPYDGPAVEFREELPVPLTNIELYEGLYVLEQWFRRIAYASLLARYGSTWRSALPTDLVMHLKKRLKQLEGRVHLQCENSNNAIWLLTLEELRVVLLAETIWPTVKVLTGLPRGVLDGRLAEMREIRNVVGHSRATTRSTVVILHGLAQGLRPGIERFKEQLLYQENSEIHVPDGETSDELVPDLYEDFVRHNDWSEFQPMLSESRFFYSLTRLPVAPFDHFLPVSQFVGQMRNYEDALLAVLVNKVGDEFTLTWPKAATHVEHDGIVRFFFASQTMPWTETEYSSQRVSALCDPRVWFYENRRPTDD